MLYVEEPTLAFESPLVVRHFEALNQNPTIVPSIPYDQFFSDAGYLGERTINRLAAARIMVRTT
jgi:hypothetical protein